MIENVLKLIVSVLIGFILGRERKKHAKEAGGSRTLAIVSLASCLLAILTLEIQKLNPTVHNFTRLLAYGISGISFLGAGIIWKKNGEIEGLTTASTLWILLPINYCIGLGFWVYGFVTTILTFILLESKYFLTHEK